MKFMCLECQRPMELGQVVDQGAGILAVEYSCPGCSRGMAMVTNPGETQMVNSLGVQIGHERVAPQPMSVLRGALAEGHEIGPAAQAPRWSEAAERRLAAAPPFVQGMIRRIYDDWAVQHDITEITPEVMNQARDQLGLMGM